MTWQTGDFLRFGEGIVYQKRELILALLELLKGYTR